MKPPLVLSYTQMKVFTSSPADWYMRYVLKEKTEKTAALEFGSKVHDQLEMSLKKETFEPSLDLKRICNEVMDKYEGILSLPHEIETDIIIDFNEFKIRGIVDLKAYDKENNKIHIVDHKTVSETFTYDKQRKVFRRRFYGNTKPEQIKSDMQLNLYAFLAILGSLKEIGKDLNTLKIELEHNQIIKVRKKDMVKELRLSGVKTETTLHEVFDSFCETFSIAKEISELYNQIKGEDIRELIPIYNKPLTELTQKWQYGAINPFWDYYVGLE